MMTLQKTEYYSPVMPSDETPIRIGVSPSLLPQRPLTPESQNDVILRKVRGLLNKITMENFQRLSDTLLEFDLNSKSVQQGVVHLLIEKAGDVPKYSHMCAQLCKKLSVKSPNFRTLLMNECNNLFMNRSILIQTIDDENQKIIVKQKMLGTHKFIGELYMLDLLCDKWVHCCIKHLLDINKNGSFKDRCDDMEYLSSLFGTCGTKLDTDGDMKFRMDQYFEEIEIYSSESKHFPVNIRFMLCDVIDLRNSHWVPRVVRVENLAAVKSDRKKQKNEFKPHKLNDPKSSWNLQQNAGALNSLSSVISSSHRDDQNTNGKKYNKQIDNIQSSSLSLSYATNHLRIRL